MAGHDMDFHNLDWHDAEIECITVNRVDPGNNDEVTLKIKWSNGSKNIVTFHDCYQLIANLNFGILAKETIYSACISEESAELLRLKEKWKAISKVSLDDLKCFEIVTNSTNSKIQILSFGYSLS